LIPRYGIIEVTIESVHCATASFMHLTVALRGETNKCF
jgi:hypothetical protein